MTQGFRFKSGGQVVPDEFFPLHCDCHDAPIGRMPGQERSSLAVVGRYKHMVVA
jgi:hypothetical protein